MNMPCVSCGRASNTSTPDDAEMCWKCFGEFNAACVDGLEDALRDVLKAICTDRHAVQDVLWVNGSPVGDFIMCALDEDIDLDELQNAPYRCNFGDSPWFA